MTYDVRRGKQADPTMPRTRCREHGESVAQCYAGRERYACLHCATAEYEQHVASTGGQS